MIVSSSLQIDPIKQVDGRFWVTETHSLDDGTSQVFQYLASPDVDTQAVMTSRASAINEAIVEDAQAVPYSITSIQARRAIDRAGLRPSVEAAVAVADPDTQALWYTTEVVDRQNPVMLALAQSLGLSSAQVDDLFRAGAKL